MSSELKLGHSPLTDRIYLGSQNKGIWSGKKRDITNDFIQVMLQKFEPNTAQKISIDGETKYGVIVVDTDKKVVIDGKIVK